MKKLLFFLLLSPFYFLLATYYIPVWAGPQSTTYELKEYEFGSGGITSGTSPTYQIFGTAGEVAAGKSDSTTYTVGEGLIFAMQANTPPAPTFTNPGNNYDRLKIVIATGSNPTDTKFAVAISTDNFVTTRYVKSDNTVGDSLVSADWRTYTGWSGASGGYITGLTANTTYKVKVAAQQGLYTQTGYGPISSATTVDPTLTFSVSGASVTFNNLNAGNSYTDNSQTTVLTTSTNAYNGYIVYSHEDAALTWNGQTIADYGSPNSAPTSWSGNGFGYTTSATNLAGGTANRFNNGTYYAGFTTTAPGDPVASHSGPVLSSITNEQFTITYRVTTSVTQPAGVYRNTLSYIVVPTY